MSVSVRRLGAAQDGFTLIELLVVLAILGVVLAASTVLFTSGLTSQKDQTNRTQAQQGARLGLDKLRREIRCASDLTTPSGYPASTVTIALGSYCSTAGGAATTVTWCTRNAAGTGPPVAGAQPYTLWRYTGATCGSGSGTKWASDLVDKADAPSVTAGKIFGSSRVPTASSVTSATTGGTLGPGTYSYDVTAVLASGTETREIPGTVASVTIASGLTNKITLSWSAYVPMPPWTVTSYNVYGRDGAGLRLLKNVTSGTSYVDLGPTSLTDNPLTVPNPMINVTINVASTSSFNSGANTITFGPSGPVTCTGTGTAPTRFTGCTGGQAGQYPKDMPVYSASSARPPRMNLTVTLPVDKTSATTSQRFVLTDDIVLRNSQPF